MARRMRRVILAVLGAVVLMLVLAVVLLPVLVPQDRLRAMATARVHAATGGEVVLGDVSLKVLPRLRLVLGRSNLSLTGAGMRGAGLQPGALDSANLGLERLELDLALAPLLKKKLEFGKIRLVGPDVRLITRPVVAADSAGIPSGRAGDDAAASPWGLALAGAEVRDGHVLWREAGTPRRIEITGWKQDISGSDIGLVAARAQRFAGLPPAPGQQDDRASGDATLGLRATAARLDLAGFGSRPLPPLTDLVLDARIEIPLAADRVNVTVTELSLPGWKATCTGHADRRRVTITELNLTGAEGAVDLSGNLSFASPPSSGHLRGALSGRIDVAGARKAAQTYLPPPAPGAEPPPEVTGTVSVAVFAGIADAPPLGRADLWQAALASGELDTLRLTAESTDLVVAMPQLGEPLRLPRLEYRGDLGAAGLPHHVMVRGLAHPVVQGDATLDLGIGPKGTAHHAELKLDRFDLDALTAIVRQQQAAAAPQARATWSLIDEAFAANAGRRPAGEMIPAELKVAFTAAADEVLLMKTPYRSVRLGGDLADRVFHVTSLRADLGGGEVTGTARVDYASDPEGMATFDFAAARVPANTLLAALRAATGRALGGTTRRRGAGELPVRRSGGRPALAEPHRRSRRHGRPYRPDHPAREHRALSRRPQGLDAGDVQQVCAGHPHRGREGPRLGPGHRRSADRLDRRRLARARRHAGSGSAREAPAQLRARSRRPGVDGRSPQGRPGPRRRRIPPDRPAGQPHRRARPRHLAAARRGRGAGEGQGA